MSVSSKQIIVDDAHGGANGVFFLPPVVPQPVLSGVFDPNLSPVVRIDDLAGPEGPFVGTLATYSTTTGPGSDTVRVDNSAYVVNWNTHLFTLDLQHTYRINVLVDGRVLGKADVQPVVNGGQMKNVDTSSYVPLVDGRTLVIKFWLNQCAPVICPTDACKLPGLCNGSTGQCSYQNQPDGTACSDGNACTQTDTCQAGACVGANPVACPASDQCHAVGQCDPATGTCSNPAQTDGTGCDDGDRCTRTDTCQAGVCTGANPVVCVASDQCHDPGTCDSVTGACSNPPSGDGKPCNDGSLCTQFDVCDNGVCSGQSPVVCAAADQCHDAGACDPGTGACTDPVKPDGVPCVDGDACTQTDACSGGVCVGANPVICNAADQCHDAGECNPLSGACSNPSKPDGTQCNDGNLCTQSDSCLAGACSGSNPVVCGALDQCHVAGECVPATGKCTDPARADGTACNDGNPCTQTDKCQAGACAGGNPVVCTAMDQCHDAGECNTTTGACSNPARADGTECNDGNVCTQTSTCLAGACTGSNPVTCPLPDQCQLEGTCVPASGDCVFANKPDGTECDDGNPKTLGDTCVAGQCAPGEQECVTTSMVVVGGGDYDGSLESNGHTCVLRSNGKLYCFGFSNYGEVGSGTATIYNLAPVLVVGNHTWKTVATGKFHTCGITTAGELYCWGQDRFYGQLGTGLKIDQNAPAPVGGTDWQSHGTVWTSVVTGYWHTCATRDDHSLWCWGYNGHGQLGVGDVANRSLPTLVTGSQVWDKLRTGSHHICGLTESKNLWCWGYNFMGELGIPDRQDRARPTQVGADTWQDVQLGHEHTCGLKIVADGDPLLMCWGSDARGAVGDGTPTAFFVTPTPVATPLTGWSSIAVGGRTSCAIHASDHSLYCWGQNTRGQLPGSNPFSDLPTPAEGGDLSWESVSMSVEHACGLTTDGRLWCWGNAGGGRLATEYTPQPGITTPHLVAEGGCLEVCGDGKTDWFEECDDGNTATGDGCRPDCKREKCGDGIVQPGVGVRGMEFLWLNASAGGVYFTMNGKYLISSYSNGPTGCYSPIGRVAVTDPALLSRVVNGPNRFEVVAEGKLAWATVRFFGKGIQEEVIFDATPTGDALVHSREVCLSGSTTWVGQNRVGTVNVTVAGEECDDANQINSDACTNFCGTGRCGDHHRDANEECDDGNANPNDGCSATCLNERCGDLIKQTSETCDDGNTLDGDGCSAICK